MENNVKITWEGKEGEVVLKQLTWGEHKMIREQSIVLKEYKGLPQQFRNVDLMDDLRILASIKTAPFDAVMKNVDKLSKNDRHSLALAVSLLDGEKNVNTNKSS